MAHRPVRVTADVGAQPGIAFCDAAVVHVIAQVRDHEGDRRQPREGSGRKAGEGQADRAGHVAEVCPWHVLACVFARRADRRSRAGQVLRVTGEALARLDQVSRQVRRGEPVRAAVIGYALGTAGEQRQVVRLARVGDRVGAGEQRTAAGKLVDERRGRVADDVRVGVVLHHDHDRVRWFGDRGWLSARRLSHRRCYRVGCRGCR